LKRFLVDTHALLWWLADDAALPVKARDLIADAAGEALVSVASLWEIAIKRSIGKLQAPDALPETIVAEGFAWLPIEPAHAWAVRSLADHHRDPFDRLLIAQSLAEDLPVVTGDPRFAGYGVEVCWS
jgi:PIN domain nuclease of toxin-antitoxin system